MQSTLEKTENCKPNLEKQKELEDMGTKDSIFFYGLILVVLIFWLILEVIGV